MNIKRKSNRSKRNIGILLPPSPRGPGMVKSPPLDIANLIAMLRKEECNIRLMDYRSRIVNQDHSWQANGVDLDAFNEFKRCFDHILIKEDLKLKNISLRILKEINLRNLEFLVFSVSILEQFSLQYLVSSLCIAKEVKSLKPRIKIVFFGNCPKKHVRMIMRKFKFLDAFPEDGSEFSILDYVKNAHKKRPINGICYRDNGGLVISPSSKKLNLSRFSMPDFSLFDIDQYKSNGQLVLPYEISRGCVNNCFYCYYIHKRSLTYKSVRKVVAELKALSKQHKTNTFHFIDAAINFDEEYLSELCEELIKKFPGAQWSALAVPNINYDLLKKMKESGCVQLRWGVECGSERILKIINKNTSSEMMKEVLRHSHDLGIYNYITLLSGLEIEREEDVDLTKQFISEIKDYVDSAQECVFGELGHFSIFRLEKLLSHNDEKDSLRRNRYDEVLKKNNIASEDIIEQMTKDRSILFLIAPNNRFPFNKKEGEGDDKIPHREVFSAISCLKSIKGVRVDYFNFPAFMTYSKKIHDFFAKRNPKDLKSNILELISFMMPRIKKNDYYAFFVPLWNENLEMSLALAKKIKEAYPSSKNIFFGPYCNLYPEQVSKYPFVDFVITSEPEVAMEDILFKKDRGRINNIAYCDKRSVMVNPEQGLDLAKIGFNLDYQLYFDFIEKYKLPSPSFLYFELSRGCIYRCFFCALLTYSKHRAKDLDFAINELKKIVEKTGIKYIFLTDNELNFDNEYLERFLDALISAKLNIRWSSYMVAKGIDLGLMKKMKRSGCIFLRWGIESVNPKKQEIISKNLDPEEVSKIIAMSSGLGIKNQVSFTIGYPFDCELDRALTIDFIERNYRAFHCVNLNRFKPRKKSLSNLYPHKYGIKIVSDDCRRDQVPFEEINGLDWNLKNEQQKYYQRTIEDKLKEYNLKDSDPELFFMQLINGGFKGK